MAIIVTAPNENYTIATISVNTKLFLAGGITGCRDWQSEAIEEINKSDDIYNVTIFNPRRLDFNALDPNIEKEQICWEFKHLAEADMLAFWFAKETINPIVLYELGKWGNSSDKPVFIGVEEGYERKRDVIIQTALARPKIDIAENFHQFLMQIKTYLRYHSPF